MSRGGLRDSDNQILSHVAPLVVRDAEDLLFEETVERFWFVHGVRVDIGKSNYSSTQSVMTGLVCHFSAGSTQNKVDTA